MARFTIGLDLGGGSVRCLLLDPTTGRVVTGSRPFASTPAPGTHGLGFDLDLERAMDALAAATRDALERAGAQPGDIAGIACASMRHGNVVLDAAGVPLLAVPNRDARAVGPGLTQAAQHGEALHALGGHWPLPIFAAARLRWLVESEPEMLARAAHFLFISDWVAYRLTGELATDASQAGESLLFDLERDAWSFEWIDRLEIPRHLFPEVRPSGSSLGALTSEAAERLGLRAGTPVFVGGADTQTGLYGAGVTNPGDVCIVAGTTGPVQTVVDAPVVDPEARVWTGRHVLPERWVLESNAGPMGDCLDWLGRVLFPDAPDNVGGTAMLLGDAAASEPGACGLLSSFGAQVMNAKMSSLPVGHLSLTHMSSASDHAPRHHLARATVEGIACGIRANLEQVRGVSGRPNGAVHLAGGLARSGFFAQVIADVLGEPVHLHYPETSALGAASLAAGGGAVRRPEARLVSPDPKNAEAHQELCRRWEELRTERAAADATASRLATPFVLAHQAAPASEESARARPRILVTSDCDDESLTALAELGNVEYASYRDKKRMLTGPSLIEALAGVNVFVTEIDLVDAAAIDQLPELRVIASCRGDAVNVDIDACTAFGIPMLRTPGRNADAVADLTIAFLLMLARKLPSASEFLRAPGIQPGDMGRMGQAFAQLRGSELWKKTIGLVGLGAVGVKVCERLRGFGAHVLVADPFVSSERAAAAGALSVSLEQLLSQSDFVSLHAAVTPETTGMLGAPEFSSMKSGACLVNTARAALLDEDALVDALASGHLGGAALDTFAVEPPGSDHPLLTMDNVIATPHVGGNTRDVAAHQGEIVAGELARLLAGDAPRFVVNPDVLDSFSWTGPRPRPSAAVRAKLAEGPAPAVSDLQKKKKTQERKAPETSEPQQPVADTDGKLPASTRDAMRRITARFVEQIVADAAMCTFSKGRSVTLHFDLEDADCEFHFSLDDGTVTGASGAPDQHADVQLRLGADVLDGMFTGRVNPMEAAMAGRLAFTGDAAKAMTLQHLQDDLSRLYSSAREAVGDPGDLTPPAGTATSPAPVAPGDIREDLVAVVRELYEGQVITATGGNVSVRIPGEDALWITPSQLFKGDLHPEVLVRIGLDGRSLDPGSRSPSSEWDMHCAILERRSEAVAVVHAHAPNATILANSGLPFLPISTEAAFFGDIPRVPFIMPGTPELASQVAEAMGDGWAVLLVNHGIVVAGRSLRRAADMVEIIERTAEVILGCYAVGKPPPTLPEDVVAQLREMGDLVA